jgi:hypothetical protein
MLEVLAVSKDIVYKGIDSALACSMYSTFSPLNSQLKEAPLDSYTSRNCKDGHPESFDKIAVIFFSHASYLLKIKGARYCDICSI